MSDYDVLINMFELRGIKFYTDWSKEALFDSTTRLIKWITVRSLNDNGVISMVDFKFSLIGKLESITTSTDDR